LLSVSNTGSIIHKRFPKGSAAVHTRIRDYRCNIIVNPHTIFRENQ